MRNGLESHAQSLFRKNVKNCESKRTLYLLHGKTNRGSAMGEGRAMRRVWLFYIISRITGCIYQNP